MYALRDIPGKGKGLFAIKNIPRGTRILSEQPVITIPEYEWDEEWLRTHISQQVACLSEHQRQSFLSMHNLYPYENVSEQSLGIFRTNGLPIKANGIGGGFFLEACRINHACDNNAQKDWNQIIERYTVHALRDIPEGEEITIYYLGLDSIRAIRQKKLQDKFGFLCSCRLCSLPTKQSEENDKRVERIDKLDDLIGFEGNRLNFSLRTLRYVDEMIRLYNEQGLDNAGLPRAYFDAAQITIANGDLARGSVFAGRAVEGWRTAQGSDSKQVIDQGPLAQNPSKLPLYGISMKWKTSLDEIPKGLQPDDFEDWLWKREKPKNIEILEHLMDLRNRETFPSFAALPSSDSNSDFPEKFDDTYHAPRHWCFLGEIIESFTVHHLELKLMDVDNQEVPLHFYTKDLGREMAPAKIKNGYTVAVPYAKRRVFLYGDPGIRHDNPQLLKIFPVSLMKLQELNDQLQQFSMKVDGTRTCHGCSKKASSLFRCTKCSLFWYCDNSCQRTGWIERGHKSVCKLLQNADLRDLFERGGAPRTI